MSDTRSDDLMLEGPPVVRLYWAALRRDPTTAELAEGRRLVRQTGSLVALAESLAIRSGAGDATELIRRAGSPGFQATIALLPGLMPGVPPDEPSAYALWRDLYDTPSEDALGSIVRLDGPAVALAMAVSDTEVEAALLSIASLVRQIHPHWTLHLATRVLSDWPRATLSCVLGDTRVTELACQEGIDPLHAAIRAAADSAGCPDGLVALLEPGDRLAATALHEVAALFAAEPDAVMVVTDEDVADADGQRSQPRFKPAFSAVAGDAVGQLAVFRAGSLLRACGSPEPAFVDVVAGIAASAAREAGDRLRHLPAILCHRPRSRRDRTRSVPAEVRGGAAAVTVIVATRDRATLLATCADGVLNRTTCDALELLIVDNGSADADAVALLAELGRDRRVRVLHRPGPFNFASLNNSAVAEASGELLVLLNNDVEVREPSWLAELERLSMQPAIGVVGARLLYPDGTVQHAGILLGPAGHATHVGRGFAADHAGYLQRFERVHELSAVTGACLAIRREIWNQVGGMDEQLAVTFNDVDLCLRVRAAGFCVVWTPHATLVHREAQSRSIESSDAQARLRFEAERAHLRRVWRDAVDVDPFLNGNLLAAESGHLVATRPRRRRPWEARSLPEGGETVI